MTADTLAKLFGYNHYALKVNLEGVTHEQSVTCPTPQGNCANWILGHVLANRNFIAGFLNGEPVLTAAEAAPYERGSKPMKNGAGALRLERLLTDLDRSQEGILAGLKRLSPADLEAPEGKGTLADSLAFFQFHEAYHAGQVGLLRRIYGKEGAIK
jgi:uncharacterized damage-inducible protein DinB